jgi:hypothetical protein
MIAYEILVQTIADWKAGVRPTAPNPPPPSRRAPAPAPAVGQPETFEEVDSGVVDVGETEEWSEETEFTEE